GWELEYIQKGAFYQDILFGVTCYIEAQLLDGIFIMISHQYLNR
ncbi:hypothetical protein SEEK9263_07964, partial [Salmonella enterica subsp. enterica serovar Kentucky str. ATCC 9263]